MEKGTWNQAPIACNGRPENSNRIEVSVATSFTIVNFKKQKIASVSGF